MNTHSKKDLLKELATIEQELTTLQKRKDQLLKLVNKKELILPFCVKHYDREILMQGGDVLPGNLYANLHHALVKAEKQVTPLNLTRLWSLYSIVKVFTKESGFGYFTITTSIGRKWNVNVNQQGMDKVLILRKDGAEKQHRVVLPNRYTLLDLIHCLDIMSR